MSVLQREFDKESRNLIMNCQIIDGGGGGGGGALLWVLFTCVCCASSLMPCPVLMHVAVQSCVLSVVKAVSVNACRGPLLFPLARCQDPGVNGCRSPVLCPPLTVVKTSELMPVTVQSYAVP